MATQRRAHKRISGRLTARLSIMSSKLCVAETQVRLLDVSMTGLRLLTGPLPEATVNGLRHKAFKLHLSFSKGEETIADLAGAPVWAMKLAGNTTIGVTWGPRVGQDLREKVISWMQAS